MGYRRRVSALVAFARLKRRQHRRRKGHATLTSVRVCSVCGGVIVKCSHCKHAHCDDACRPIGCMEQDGATDDNETPKVLPA